MTPSNPEVSADIKERCEKLVRAWGSTCDYMKTDMTALALSIDEAAYARGRKAGLLEAAETCNNECDRKVELAKSGHKYPGALLGEASGATSCAHAIRALADAGRGKLIMDYCEHLEAYSRWRYEGEEFKGAVGYCRDCNATWEYNKETQTLTRTDHPKPVAASEKAENK